MAETEIKTPAPGNLGPVAERVLSRMEIEEKPQVRVPFVRPPLETPRSISIPAPYIAGRFSLSTLENFRPDPAEPSQRIALETVREWCELVKQGEPERLALVGPPGTGKSHLLYAAVKELHAASIRIFTRPWYRLADHLRYGGPHPYNADVRLDAEELREKILAEPNVAIDEVRPTAGTAFDDTELAKIIANAYDNGRGVLITTNVEPLHDVIGKAMVSRFTQITIVGRDRRQES